MLGNKSWGMWQEEPCDVGMERGSRLDMGVFAFFLQRIPSA